MRWVLAAVALAGGALFVLAAPADAVQHVVTITDSGYTPTPLTISNADEIFWCNEGTTEHTVTADNGAFDSEELATEGNEACFGGPAESLGPGTYPYHCSIHPQLTGTLTIEAPPTTTTSAPAVTTTTTSPPSGNAPTTVRPTPTTRRPATTRPALRRPATTPPPPTSTSTPETTTTTEFFDTTTLFTTTTFGSFAITELGEGDDGDGTFVGILVGLAILGGAGVLGYRYRWRFLR